MKNVVTYQLAYLSHRRVSLCAKCAEDAGVIQRVGVLGPVSHGRHRGECAGCERGPGRPAESADGARDVELRVRVSPKEKTRIEKLAAEANTDVSSYVRGKVL